MKNTILVIKKNMVAIKTVLQTTITAVTIPGKKRIFTTKFPHMHAKLNVNALSPVEAICMLGNLVMAFIW